MDPDADLSPVVSRPRLHASQSDSRRKNQFIASDGIGPSKPSSRRLHSRKSHTGRAHSFNEERQQHHRSQNRSSSGHHHDYTKRRHSGDSIRRSTEKESSNLKNYNGIGKASKKISKLMNPRRLSSTSSSSSKQKHRNEEQSHDDFSSLYEVFYDEDGQKIVIPRKKPQTKSAPEAEIIPPETSGRDYSHHSSQYNSDSDNSNHDRDADSGSSSRIEGASDFEDDSIDGASIIDNHEDEKMMAHSSRHYKEESYGDGVRKYNCDSTDVMSSDVDEIIEYDDDDDDSVISYQEQDTRSLHCKSRATKRSNSPELNVNRKQTQSTKKTMEQIARNFYSSPARHRDPPIGEDESILSHINDDINNMDPNEDDGATLRLDRPPTPESDRCNDIGDQYSQMSVRGRRDPPEQGKGCDPPYLPRFGTSPQNAKGRNKKKTELRSILKKKEGAAPPPVAYFGRTSQYTSEHNSVSDSDSDDSGSDPDVSEVKSKGGNEDDTSETISLFENNSVNTAKSGLRSGRFAEANAAAAAAATDSSIVQTTETNTKPSNTVDFHTSFPTLNDDDNSFNRKKSYFMRTSDLGLTQDTIFPEQFLDNPKSRPEPHYHHPSPHPPPNVQFNCDENWISIDDGNGTHSPIAPQAVDALVAAGYRCASDPLMWTPTSKTRKLMTDSGLCFDDIPTPAPPEEEGGRGDSSCLVWRGKFLHKYHGHDLPVVRSQGVVNMSAEHLVDLLMDSSRVQSYNVSSIGRTDELILSDGKNLDTCPFSGQRRKKLTGVVVQGVKIVNGAAVGFEGDSDVELSDCEEEEGIDTESKDDGKGTVRTLTSHLLKEPQKSRFVGVTKIVKSTNKVPMRKSLEYITLLHCRALTDDQGGNGYIIVGRAVKDACKASKDTQRAEILLNVYIIRRLRDKRDKKEKRDRSSSKDRAKPKMRDRCVMICVSHVKSPIMPHLLAKKISLRAASSFITDIRALTEE